jgi:hypothetical protein
MMVEFNSIRWNYKAVVHLEKRTIIGAIKAIALEQPLMGTRREIQISSFTR